MLHTRLPFDQKIVPDVRYECTCEACDVWGPLRYPSVQTRLKYSSSFLFWGLSRARPGQQEAEVQDCTGEHLPPHRILLDCLEGGQQLSLIPFPKYFFASPICSVYFRELEENIKQGGKVMTYGKITTKSFPCYFKFGSSIAMRLNREKPDRWD